MRRRRWPSFESIAINAPAIPASNCGRPCPGRSFEKLNLGVMRRWNPEPRNICVLKVRIEEAVQAVRRNGDLARAFDRELTEQTEDARDDTALQERAVIAEREMVRAPDRNA